MRLDGFHVGQLCPAERVPCFCERHSLLQISDCNGEEFPKQRLVLLALLLPAALPWKERRCLWSRIKDNFVLGRGKEGSRGLLWGLLLSMLSSVPDNTEDPSFHMKTAASEVSWEIC